MSTSTFSGFTVSAALPATTDSSHIYILNNPVTTTLNNALLTASAITNNFAHSATINSNGFDIKNWSGAVLSTVDLSTISVAKAGSAYSVEWANITGKPTTFTPSTHAHTIAQVTGLQNALDINYATFCDLRRNRESQLLTGHYFEYNIFGTKIDYQNAIIISGTLSQMTINFIDGLRKPTIIHLIDYRGKHGWHGSRRRPGRHVNANSVYYSNGRKKIESKSYVFPRGAYHQITDTEYSARTLTINWTEKLHDPTEKLHDPTVKYSNWGGNCLRTDCFQNYHYYGIAFIYEAGDLIKFPNGFTEILKSSNLLNLI